MEICVSGVLYFLHSTVDRILSVSYSAYEEISSTIYRVRELFVKDFLTAALLLQIFEEWVYFWSQFTKKYKNGVKNLQFFHILKFTRHF